LSSWHQDFKKEWQALEKQQITLPMNDAYKPNAEKWTCTCPHFVTSCFLICKHLVQSIHHVPPVFFLKVKHYQQAPFWRHNRLKALDNLDHIDDEGIAGLEDGDDGEVLTAMTRIGM
jgi:hypothetical protein